jgi:hypothetical protein
MKKEQLNLKEIYKSLIPEIQEANRGITHDEFIKGVDNGTIGIKIMWGEPADLITGPAKTAFRMHVMLYLWAPLILVPLFSYFAHNWFLLFGIAFSYLFSRLAAWHGVNIPVNWKPKFIYLFGVFCIGYWFFKGFHFYDYITFYFFCSLWGHFFFLTAEEAQKPEHAIQSLKENRNLFNHAIEHSIIMIIYREK